MCAVVKVNRGKEEVEIESANEQSMAITCVGREAPGGGGDVL